MNLVYVLTVYNQRLRVDQDDLDNPDKILIPVYNRDGVKIFDSMSYDFKRDSGRAMLHKDNILVKPVSKNP